MAARRKGGYGDNKHRDCNSDIDVSRIMKDSRSRHEYDRVRRTDGTDPLRYRSHVQDITSKVRVRQDYNEWDRSSAYMYSSSSSRSSSGGGSKQCKLSRSAMDREEGELCSDSESDEAFQSVSQVKEEETSTLENGPALPLETKKRKFSPIVWDRDVMDASTTTLPSLYKPILKSSGHIPYTGKQITLVADSVLQRSETLLHKPPLELGVDKSSELQQLGLLEEDDCFPTSNISVSRWADSSFSGDEEESNEDIVNRRGIVPLSESIGMRVRSKSLTPQLVELNREGSDGSGARSSESEEGGYSGRSSRNSGDNVDNNNFMEMDEEDYEDDTSLSQSCIPEPVASPPRTVNMLKGSRSVEEFERLNKINEGTYGVVYRARNKRTGEIVALKKVKMEKEREGFPLTSLREINILLSLHHQSIVDVKEVVVGSNLDSIFMVMEYMEHDLKGLMETMKQPFSQSEVKCLMLQLLEGIKYLHKNWVMHRDLKTSNLLFNNRGELKICDLGMARQYGIPLQQYTHLVVTLWYRAPELLLGAKLYSTAIDMWSLGCIMAEMLSKTPLFDGKTEVDQLDKIFRILGTPNESIWPGFSKLPGVKVKFVNNRCNVLRKMFPGTPFIGSPVLSDSGFDLLSKLLTYDPEKRITAEDALNHPWFSEVPLPKSREFMPTFPTQHAKDRRSRRVMKSPDPLEEQRLKELQQGTGGLFG